MSDTSREKYSSVEDLRKQALRTDAFISAIRNQNKSISHSLATIIKEIGKAREECEESKDLSLLRIIFKEIERIGRASQGIDLLLGQWEQKK